MSVGLGNAVHGQQATKRASGACMYARQNTPICGGYVEEMHGCSACEMYVDP